MSSAPDPLRAGLDAIAAALRAGKEPAGAFSAGLYAAALAENAACAEIARTAQEVPTRDAARAIAFLIRRRGESIEQAMAPAKGGPDAG